MDWLEEGNEESGDFFKIFADIAFCCLGLFFLLLIVLLMTFKQSDISLNLGEKSGREYLSKNLEDIVTESGLGEVVAENSSNLAKVQHEIVDVEDDLEYYSHAVSQLQGELKIPQGTPLKASRQQLDKEIKNLQARQKRIGVEFNKYVQLKDGSDRMSFTIKGDRYKWWVVITGARGKNFYLRPETFVAFKNALRLGSGLYFYFQPNNKYQIVPNFAKKYVGEVK